MNISPRHKYQAITITALLLALVCPAIKAQQSSTKVPWIRPDNNLSAPLWGIAEGIVVSIWPAPVENGGPGPGGGPRGLLRIGYEHLGKIFLINYIAVEPQVAGDMEFSEVSPSRVDGQWGKFFWSSDTTINSGYSPYTTSRGVISHPDKSHPRTEQLSWYILMEKFLDGASPYLKLTIRSDKPGELGIQVFNHEKSALMERCALTATMGNYSRLRLLYLAGSIIDSRAVYAGYDDIGFAEKEPYAEGQMLRNQSGDPIAIAESNESFDELASWPQEPAYLARWGWRYRPFYKLTQYWRVDAANYDPSLHVRVNGRAKYWAGDSADKKKYVNVPGGPAFENFELREKYYPGQKFYFGLTTKSAKELISSFSAAQK